MKKICALLILLGLIWLTKLSYDMYVMSNNLLKLQNDVYKSEQKNASLNDRLVALQRTGGGVENKTQVIAQTSKNSTEVSTVHPASVVKSRLELIQFAIQQRQYVYALEKLNQLELSLNEYNLAESNRESLHTAISKDKQNLQQFIFSRQVQIDQLAGLLTQLDVALSSQQQNQNIQHMPKDEGGFWSKWIKIERVDLQTPDIVYRRLILKEGQLRVLLAQQKLEQGHILDYQNMLNLAEKELSLLPDQHTQKILKDLQKLKQTKIIREAKLMSLEIMG